VFKLFVVATGEDPINRLTNANQRYNHSKHMTVTNISQYSIESNGKLKILLHVRVNLDAGLARRVDLLDIHQA
jgi:hypothetical protein